MPKGVPKRDGTGRGRRANKGRGGCINPQTLGRGSGTKSGLGRPARGSGRGSSCGRRGRSAIRR